MLLILNTGNRLDPLLPLFEWFSKNGHGKLNSTHFTIGTNYSCHPNSQAEAIFQMLQEDSARKGFTFNCYCLSIVA